MEHRIYVKVTVSREEQVRCKLTSGTIHSLERCENCGDFTQTALLLACEHHLCQECSATCTAYICSEDHTKTLIEQAQRKPAVYDQNLSKATLECPYCQSLGNIEKTAEHIIKRHSELLKGKPAERSQGIGKNSHEWSSEERQGRIYTSTDEEMKRSGGHVVGSGLVVRPLVATGVNRQAFDGQQASSTPKEKTRQVKEKAFSMGNMKGGAYDVTVGTKSSGPTRPDQHSKSEEKHELTSSFWNDKSRGFSGEMLEECRVQENSNEVPKTVEILRPSAPVLGTHGKKYECEWSEKTAGDVRELQKKARELEEKLNRIEEPLIMLTDRLRRCC
ncbi:hypothetical protein V5799_006737 [Amblyomma americanum]|uniref:RING-type domain-containing protein n=1 Tax=Amblyomma americanum TaxID=6943 RepID=A0AAQ4DVJ2_AMBAM